RARSSRTARRRRTAHGLSARGILAADGHAARQAAARGAMAGRARTRDEPSGSGAGTAGDRGGRGFLTGRTRIKGAGLGAWLRPSGASVVGYALAPDGTPNRFDAARIGRDMESIIANIRHGDTLRAAIRAASPEIVFHMAAQSLVRRSYREPIETYDTNVMGTAHVLEAVRTTPSVRAVVIVTSDKCYENQGLARGYVETDPMGGHDPYSSSRACAEPVTSAYRRSFLADGRVAVASVRAGNVIGGGDWAEDRLVPDIVRAASTNTAVVVRNPDSVRPWQFVLEPLRGYLMLG